MKKLRIVIISSAMVFGLIVTLQKIPNKNAYIDKVNADLNHGSASWGNGAQTIDELIEISDLIIEGKVVSYEPHKTENLIFTHETVEVKKALKGDVSKGDQIVVSITGGELDGTITPIIKDCPLMDMRGTYMLFLHKLISGRYGIVAGNQGFGMIENNKINVTDNDDLAIKIKDFGVDKLEKYITDRVSK